MSVIVVRRWPTPTRNSVQLQMSSIDFGIRGIYFPWLSEISYEMNLEPGEARGASVYPMGVTVGELKATASVTIQRIYRERVINIFEQGSPGFMDKFAPLTVTVQEFGWNSVETDSMEGRITGAGHEYSAGNGVLMVKLPLYVPYIKLNGHVPVAGIVI